MSLNESIVEEVTLTWFGELCYEVGHGPRMAPGEEKAERESFGDVVLVGRLREAVERLNPGIPAEAREEAVRKVLRVGVGPLVGTNRAFHRLLRDGVGVEFARADGSITEAPARLVDFCDAEANDWLVVNQFTVVEGHHNRRPDVVVFVNGLPLGIIELKNPADEDADIWAAYRQLQTYKVQIGTLLHYNAALVVSDGLQARIGSLTANQEWFKVWRTIEGETDAGRTALELEVLVRGVFEKRRFLDLLEHFIVFDEDADSGTLHKIIAGYHQFHAVNAAVEETVRASGMSSDPEDVEEGSGNYWVGRMHGGRAGDRKAGVVWHTQGSGKSFSMLFYAARVVRHPAMKNPTLVVLTDRNDLDDQLFGQFQRCADILGQVPVQATGREDLRQLLKRASGGVVFTTIHKFMPEKGEAMPALSPRQNIVVIADEAHRSQYGFGGRMNPKSGEMAYGFASNLRDALPNASFIGFTGTPIEKTDANTRAVFGDYISVYDIQRAVADKATVPIYYESRIAKLSLNAAQLPTMDAEFEEITEGEEPSRKERLKSKWAALEALVGDEKRIKLIAADIVAHFEKRLEAMDGKAMIVCMSRRICVDLFQALVELRPEWEEEVLKVVMTGSAEDGPEWQKHIGTKQQRRELANRFKDAKDPFKVVIVRDMWLTGFDAPCLHTMYADKPMQGHGLMQAIARVNRVFRDKPGGLVVDYLGLAVQLKTALVNYTESGGRGEPAFETGPAIAVMLEKHGVACDMLHGFDWGKWVTGTPGERLQLLPSGQEHILEQQDGKKRWIQVVTELSRAFALCAATDEAAEIRDDVSYFQALQAALSKQSSQSRKAPEQVDAAIRQLVNRAITTEGQVIDVFTEAGLTRPDISILSDQFLAEVRGLKHKNVAVELLEKLLRDELKVLARQNLVQSQLFSEKLKQSLIAYHNRSISALEMLDVLISTSHEVNQ
ncbi:MAG TPA: type I restriction endonuclease subunit R, partial [Planctomycetota bacterium]|nr:type I restriction endonuclease subunit R [Planctomycetota bacterium]